MKNLLLILSTSLLFIGCTQTQTIDIVKAPPPKAKVSNMISKIPIPFKDTGYKNINTQIMVNQIQLDKFLLEIKSQKEWEKKENFLNTLKREKIDFQTHNLLLYHLTEDSSTILFAIDLPKSLNQKITVTIDKEIAKVKTDKVTDYALAYLVEKSIKEVTFNDGESNTTVNNRESN